MPSLVRWLVGVVALAALLPAVSAEPPPPLSLDGEWRFRLDPYGVGTEERWFAARLPDRIRLPGSTDEQGFGTRTIDPAVGRLTRVYQYVGPAWYQRDVTVPEPWRGKRVTLFLERCHWETQVWIDDREIGVRNSLISPQTHDVTSAVTPGEHRLTIRVDNTVKIDIGGWGHSITDETQTNWNGIVGRMELRASDPVWIEALDAFPDVEKRLARVRATVGNATGAPVSGSLRLKATEGATRVEGTKAFEAAGEHTTVEIDLALGDAVRLWDEFSPTLYHLTASLEATGGARKLSDERRVTFGMREFGRKGTQFVMNGRPIFLRGTLECAIFPRTGYPPTDVASWRRICDIAKSYGLNHLRFHSWCPPEAAFAAADEAAFMLQVETPLWVGNAVDADPKRAEFIQAEVDRILDCYGHHPAFCMLSMGNELLLGGADSTWLQKLVDHCRQKDPRHQYTCCTSPYDARRNDDYFVSHFGPGGALRGAGRLNSDRPSTDFDYSRAIAGADRPIIAHELGQWAMYANFEEIPKYTGPLKPRNFEVYRESLARHGMLDEAEAFRKSSGELIVRLYREEIEDCLRTPGLPGFQLLDVHDFPGQGTALVGMLDPFWDSKGLITPEAFRRYCSPTVPLLRMSRREWTTGDTLTARVEVAHYGPGPIADAEVRWSIREEGGQELALGKLPRTTLPTGTVTQVGEIAVPLAKAHAPARLTATLSMEGTEFANDWSVWVYPPELPSEQPGDVIVATEWNAETREALAKGRKVLLLPKMDRLHRTIPGSFTPVFWCFRMFGNQPGTMGILCDPKHPALAQFPTDSHGDWQWWSLLTRSKALILDDAPAEYRPIVQVIDNFDRNHKLGAVFEANVGAGRLLVSTIDLVSDLESRPAARQLRHSLLAYMNSEAFRPKAALSVSLLDQLLEPSPVLKLEGAPKDLAKAVLYAKAAMNVPLRTSQPWQAAHDQVVVKKEGFGYSISGGTWQDETGAAWHDPHLGFTVTCPKAWEGTLYAHFHDWNNLGRTATLAFEGKDLGTLGDYAGPGFWLALPVTNADSADGQLALSATATSGPNVMITQIVLIPREGTPPQP